MIFMWSKTDTISWWL